jgi:hypothetical protein
MEKIMPENCHSTIALYVGPETIWFKTFHFPMKKAKRSFVPASEICITAYIDRELYNDVESLFFRHVKCTLII